MANWKHLTMTRTIDADMIKQLMDVLKGACMQMETENNKTHNNVDILLNNNINIHCDLVIHYVGHGE